MEGTKIGKAVNIPIRLPEKVDTEVAYAAQKLGLKKSQLYRNLIYTALEDYRVVDRFGLVKAAVYIAGAKGRLKDRLDDVGEDLEPEQS